MSFPPAFTPPPRRNLAYLRNTYSPQPVYLHNNHPFPRYTGRREVDNSQLSLFIFILLSTLSLFLTCNRNLCEKATPGGGAFILRRRRREITPGEKEAKEKRNRKVFGGLGDVREHKGSFFYEDGRFRYLMIRRRKKNRAKVKS